MSKKKFTAIVVPVMALLAILMAVVIALCFVFRNTLSMYFGKAASNISQETLGAGAQLTEDIVEEGTVLLKNEKDAEGVPALPLRAEEIAKVNVFGWAAYDWMTSTFGSGFSNTSLEKIKLFPALTEAGIEWKSARRGSLSSTSRARASIRPRFSKRRGDFPPSRSSSSAERAAKRRIFAWSR